MTAEGDYHGSGCLQVASHLQTVMKVCFHENSGEGFILIMSIEDSHSMLVRGGFVRQVGLISALLDVPC